jgi:type VI secretion system protein ImpL
VWGDARPSITATASLTTDLMNLYETDYIAAWDGIVQGIQGARLNSLAETKEAVAILGGPTSPLRGLLQVVDENTYLVPPAEAAKPGVFGGVTDKFKNVLEAGKQKLGVVTPVYGARVTAHFAEIHRLLGDGTGAAPIDGVIQQLQELAAKLQPIGPQVGGTNPNDPASIASVGQTANELRRDAAPLPAGIATVLSDIASSATSAVRGGVSRELQNRYEQDVVRECVAIVTNRYPFTPAAPTDVPLADFGRLFGYGGVFDTFFKEQIADLVDTSRSQWTWRSDASGAAVGGSVAMLRQVELADRIRTMFFRPGMQTPELTFRVDMPDLDLGTLRFGLDLEGQAFEYRHGPEIPRAMTWPGPKPGQVVATFEGKGGARQNIATEGEWAWFRLLDGVSVEPESETAYLFALQRGGQTAKLRVTALTIRNPFGKRLLQQFTCG